MIDLTKPEHAYFFGFAQSDGHLRDETRNRGSLSIELNKRDANILHKFKDLFPINSSLTERNRDTNFKDDCNSVTLNIYDLAFRKELKELGLPSGSKSNLITPPKVDYSKVDYVRGLIDANGSLGITSGNIPFVSITIVSEAIKNYYVNFLSDTLNREFNVNRNTRDDCYNIMVMREGAQLICKILYYQDCFCIGRKRNKANEVVNWVRPNDIKKRNFKVKKWTKEEDSFILNNSVIDSMKELSRTEKSVKIRLWRLKNNS